MRIYVDQVEEKMVFPPEVSLGEIIDQLCIERISEDRVITHVRVNGNEVLEDEDGSFPNMPGGEIDSLELQTELSREMAFRGIADAVDYLKNLTTGIEKTAELFRVGEDLKAHEQYGLCMEGLNWFIQVLKGVRQVLGLDYEGIVFSKVTVQAHIQNLEHVIRDMLTSQSDEDWVMLSDLLEYELLPLLGGWKDIMLRIEAEASGSLEKTGNAETTTQQ